MGRAIRSGDYRTRDCVARRAPRRSRIRVRATGALHARHSGSAARCAQARRAASAARARSSATRSADGGCRSGTMIGIMPAASAARTPGSESSSTRHAAGARAEPARGLEVDVRRGLAARRPRRRRRARGSAAAAPCCASFARARSRRVDVATARGIAWRFEPVEQFVDAGLQREAFALDDGVVRRVPAGEQRVDRIAAP